jgi:anti-anti-sigma factor
VTALEVKVEPGAGYTHVRLFGEFDISGVRQFHRAVTDLDGEIVVDLRELSFIGAAGLRSLIELHLRARRDGFELAVVKGPPLVQRVFNLTGVDQRLAMRDEPSG